MDESIDCDVLEGVFFGRDFPSRDDSISIKDLSRDINICTNIFAKDPQKEI